MRVTVTLENVSDERVAENALRDIGENIASGMLAGRIWSASEESKALGGATYDFHITH